MLTIAIIYTTVGAVLFFSSWTEIAHTTDRMWLRYVAWLVFWPYFVAKGDWN